MTVSDLLEQPCYKLLTACSKLVDNLGQAMREQVVITLLSREQVVITLLQC